MLSSQVEFLDTDISCLKLVSKLVRVVFYGATSLIRISFFPMMFLYFLALSVATSYQIFNES